MTYTIKFKKSALKDLRPLPKAQALNIMQHIQALENEPRPSGCLKLIGYDNFWRIRIGEYRVIYSIEDEVLIIEIIGVPHRKDAY
jgi:mRNA interferase RelE/StbE